MYTITFLQLYKRNPLLLYYPGENGTSSSMAFMAIINTTLGGFRLDRHNTGDFYVYGLPNTALFSTILCLGSFAIAYSVKQINQSTYFSRQVLYIMCMCVHVRVCVYVVCHMNWLEQL